ncbi:hypothetical protein [Clostridium senegalense]|uniref:ABC transporter permease subunit n=1 Tax=Clostridium senegalense TaxID=1465809 RepID=A0A6M0H6R0_9CLOT|nr:hypothetical protein [Clostridium senegalense]NEU06207.1 hypothetical protein [Clostridium senegalense]
MLKLEIKRGLKRKSFSIALLITLIFCIIDIFKNDYYSILMPYINYPYFLEDFIKCGIVSSCENFIMFKFTDMSNILFCIMPVIVSMAYGDSYLEDLNSGFLKSIFSRCSKNKYFINKFFANFILAGIVFTLPLLINFLIRICFEATLTPEILSTVNLRIGSLNLNLYMNHPIVYTVIWLFIYFIFSGAIASISLAASIITRNKFIVVVIPFIVMQLITLIFKVINISEYNPMSFLYLSNSINIKSMIISFIIIVSSTFIILYLGGKNSEALQ